MTQNQEPEDFERLKLAVILLWGCERGRQDDVNHLIDMMKTGLDGWFSENKRDKEKLDKTKEFLEKIRFRCLGDAGGECHCDELEEVIASL